MSQKEQFMAFEETYQKYLDESDPDYQPSMKSLFKWFYDAGKTDGSLVIGDVATWAKDRIERDRAIGALGVLVYDGIISSGRMRELMGMTIQEQQKELKRLHGPF